jgi:serine/threonine protein kinase/tetratricopeptide (TPR) repeat protein
MYALGQTVSYRFQLLAKLGEGGIGTVFEAFDLWEKKRVALKILTLPHPTKEIKKQFQTEFELLSYFDHPGILKVFDFGITFENDLFCTMELIEGEKLNFDLSSGSFETLYEFLIRICEALEYIHLQGIIHGDLKKQNIQLTQDEYGLKVLDFGLASPVGEKRNSKIEGTIDYIPPEVLKGEILDQRADLYSLGIILYELATGKLPFQSEDPAMLMAQHLEKSPLSPKKINANLPEKLNAIILKLLEKEPSQRFENAYELKKEIEKAFQIKRESPRIFEKKLFSGKLVGREKEIELLEKILEEAKNETNQMIFILGEKGIGKKALLKRIKNQAQFSGFNFLTFKCHPTDKLNLFPDFIENLKKANADVIAIQDSHWLDENELTFVLNKIQSSFENHIFIFTWNTDERKLSLEKNEKLYQIKMNRLSLSQIPELLLVRLGIKDVPRELIQFLFKNSAGNPLLVLEWLNYLNSQKIIEIEYDRIKANFPKLERVEIPPRVRVVLEDKIKNLKFEALDLLSLASLFNEKFEKQTFNYFASLKQNFQPLQTEEFFGYLIEKEILQPIEKETEEFDGEKNKEWYQFSNESLKKIINEKIDPKEKLEWHKKLGHFFEKRFHDQKQLTAEEVAFHYNQTDEFEKSYLFSQLAAQEKIRQFANVKALEYFAIALNSAEKIEDPSKSLSKQLEILMQRGDFARGIGELNQSYEDYQEILTLTNDSPQNKFRAEAYKDLGDFYRLRQDYTKGLEFLEKALELYKNLDDPLSLAHTYNNVGNLYWIDGQNQKALENFAQALKIYQALDDQYFIASTLNNMGNVYLSQNDFLTALSYYEESLEIKRSLKDKSEIARGLNNLGLVYQSLGKIERSSQYFLDSLKLNEEIDNAREKAINLFNLSENFLIAGEFQKVIDCSASTIKLAQNIDFLQPMGWSYRNLFLAELAMGNYQNLSQLLKAAERVLTRAEDKELEILISLAWAKFYLTINEFQKSQVYLTNTYGLLQKNKNDRRLIDAQLLELEIRMENEDALETFLPLIQECQIKAEKLNLWEEKLILLLNLVKLNLKKGELSEVFPLLNQAQQQLLQAPVLPYEVEFYFLKGKAHYFQSEYEDSSDCLRLAEKKVRHLEKPELKWRIYHYLGKVFQRQLKPEEAYNKFMQAKKILQNLAQQFSHPEIKQNYLGDKEKTELLNDIKELASCLVKSKQV